MTMSNHTRGKHALTRLAPSVATSLDELQNAVRVLGEEIGAALAAQRREAELQKAEQERAPEPDQPTTIIEEASPTRGYRARVVAERLDVDPQTIWRWVREGRFPKGIKIGPMRTIWTEQMIAEWLAERRRRTVNDEAPQQTTEAS
jgi:prophage regulatory protein